jgi:Holliday junction resolvase RusA-like endonuclease
VEAAIKLEIDEMPPSVNRLYTVARGRKILSQEGRAYIARTKLALAEQLCDYRGFGRDEPLLMTYDFFFESIYNKGFPEKAKTKYKKIDVSNRLKVLEDVVCELLAIDDSQVIQLKVHKWQGKPQRVSVSVSPMADPSTQARL